MATPRTDTAKRLHAKALLDLLANEQPSLFLDLMRAKGLTSGAAARALGMYRTREEVLQFEVPCGPTTARVSRRTTHVERVIRYKEALAESLEAP